MRHVRVIILLFKLCAVHTNACFVIKSFSAVLEKYSSKRETAQKWYPVLRWFSLLQRRQPVNAQPSLSTTLLWVATSRRAIFQLFCVRNQCIKGAERGPKRMSCGSTGVFSLAAASASIWWFDRSQVATRGTREASEKTMYRLRHLATIYRLGRASPLGTVDKQRRNNDN